MEVVTLQKSLNANKPLITENRKETFLFLAPPIILFIGFIVGSFMFIHSYGG
jgi:hypothetical protein